MSRKKLPVSAEGLKVKAYPVLCQAVEEGVAYGWNRAHKHTSEPGEEVIREQIEQAVLNEVCERFDFDDDKEVES
ncbi:hypothetical protein HY496_02620 [Candidatus Woesearchaeota archaeon]|nr:hypothetical protein [Candidatus Woesearchaeota archaeon]